MANDNSKSFLVNLDLRQNQIENVILHLQEANIIPASVKEGQIWYDLGQHLVYFYNGSDAIPVGYLSPATSDTLGGVKIGENVQVIADGTISILNATNSQKGVIRIATDVEAATGTAVDIGINPLQLKTAINEALTSVLIYKGVWTIDGQSTTTYPSTMLPAKKGDVYLVNGTGPSIVDEIEWNPGDYLVFNQNVAVGTTITSAMVDKIDTTEASDIVRLNAVQTLTNKAISADDNTISELETDNFKSGVITTEISTESSDTKLPTEKAVKDQLDTKLDKNTVITGATHTKITYDSKGLVTSGTDIVTSDVTDLTATATEINQLHESGVVKSDLEKLHAITADASELNILDGITATTSELNELHGSNINKADLEKLHAITADASELNVLDGITASTSELNILNGATLTTSELNVLDGITASTSELNILDGATLTTTELNYVDGVTSNIQDQLDSKVDKTSSASKIYGTDANGDQTTYDYASFGQVDDVQLNGVSVVENKIANIEPEADDVEYHNEAVVSITNVQQALDNLINIHYYLNPEYSTFTAERSGNYDVGTVLTQPFTVSWTLNKQPEEGDVETLKLGSTVLLNIMSLEDHTKWKSGTYTYTTNITSNSPKTYTFRADYTDNHSEVPSGKTNSCYKTATFNFMYRRYWGVTSTETLTDEQLYTLSSELSTSRTQTRDFNCTGGKYWWIVIPTTYCSGITFTDVGSGLPMTLPPECISTRTITNSQNVSYSVNVYRGEFKQTAASVKIKVS